MATPTGTSDPYRTTYHRDGTVTYWSVYNQVWTRSVRVPDRELAAMSTAERERVMRHVAKARS